MVNTTLAYKIVEKESDGTIKTLFHGIDKSRTMPYNTWIKAVEKLVYDGSSSTKYLSGFHVMLSLEEARGYLKKFKTRPNRLAITLCEVRGLRSKEHSRDNVWLASEIKFIEA